MNGNQGAPDADGESGGSAPDTATPFGEVEELTNLIAAGRDKGFLTFTQISATLAEVEVTEEQIRDLHAHLVDVGIDVIADERVPPEKEEAKAVGETRASGVEHDGRAADGFAAALSALDRQSRSAHRCAGGRALEADRARRHGRQTAHG